MTHHAPSLEVVIDGDWNAGVVRCEASTQASVHCLLADLLEIKAVDEQHDCYR